MGPYPETAFQFPGMVDQTQYLKPPIGQAEKGTYGYVLDAGFQGPVHGVKAPTEMALGSGAWMKFAVGFAVVGFLENLVGCDFGFREAFEFFQIHGRGVDADPSDPPGTGTIGVFRIHRIDRADAIEDIVDIRFGMFPENQNQPLVADFSRQNLDFLANFFRGLNRALDLSVAFAETAVEAVVHAGIAQVEGREGDNPVVIDLPFDRQARSLHFLQKFRVLHPHQFGGFGRAEILEREGFGQNFPHPGFVRHGARAKQTLDFGIRDKVLAVFQIGCDLVFPDAVMCP